MVAVCSGEGGGGWWRGWGLMRFVFLFFFLSFLALWLMGADGGDRWWIIPSTPTWPWGS